MIFTTKQIQELLAILQQWELVFIGKNLGIEFLSANDKAILKAAGIDIKKYTSKDTIMNHAFAFGILSEALDDERTKTMSYDKFKRFLASGQFVPLTEDEIFALDNVKQRAYTDITGLGSRIKAGVNNVIVRANQEQQNAIRAQIKEQTKEAISLRKTYSQLASDLANLTQDWGRDWMRISYYLMHESYNAGRAQNILKNYGEDALVYHDVFKDACKHCKEFFLEDPTDPNSRPKVFKISELLQNGNNIGRKIDEWLPVIAPIHPWCRCILTYIMPGYEWDSDLKAFTKPIKYQPKNKKLQGVKLDINISKAISTDIEKGRSLPIGTVRKWGEEQKYYQKQSNGEWTQLTSVGKGKDGLLYDCFKNKPYSAISFLYKERGEATNVWHKDGLGYIGLVHGKKGMYKQDIGGFGLLHLIKKHLINDNSNLYITNLVSNINKTISDGKIYDHPGDKEKRIIKHNKFVLITRKSYSGNHWNILTFYNTESKYKTDKQKQETRDNIKDFVLKKSI